MVIKSALMTSGSDVLDGAEHQPAGDLPPGRRPRVPNMAADPGLVFDSNANDWLGFLCGTTTGVSPMRSAPRLAGAGYSFDASDLNVASIAIGDLAGVADGHAHGDQRRRDRGHLHTRRSTGMAGFTVDGQARRRSTLAAGQTQVVHGDLHADDGRARTPTPAAS